MRGGQAVPVGTSPPPPPGPSKPSTKLSKSFLRGRAQSMQQKLADIAAAVGNIQENVNSVKNSVGITNAPANNTVVAAAAVTKTKRGVFSGKNPGTLGSAGDRPPGPGASIGTSSRIPPLTPISLNDQENRDFKQYLSNIKTLINASSNAKTYKDTESIVNKINLLLSRPFPTITTIDAQDFIKITVPILQNMNINTPIPTSISKFVSSSSGGRRSRKASRKARKASRKNRKASRRSSRASRNSRSRKN